MASGGTRNRGDTVLATALAAGMTHEQAAKAAGVSKRTVARRLADPAFRSLMDVEQDRIVGRFTGTTVAGLEKAIARLTALVDSESDGVALGACRTLFEFTIRLREHATLTRRIAALEAAGCEQPNETEGSGVSGPSAGDAGVQQPDAHPAAERPDPAVPGEGVELGHLVDADPGGREADRTA